MDAIVLGIDGTGVFNKKDYRGEMGSSFVSYLCRRTPVRLRKYIRGPGWDGLDMSIIVDKGYAFVHLGLAAQPQASIFLTGYSRGGAGVIGVAKRLADDGVKVTGMVLFDAVDRSLAINSAEIPRNVLRAVFARREPLAGSRGTFGNCGTIWHAPTKTSMRNFWGTHGALGGVPWPTPPGGKSTDYIDEGLIEFQSRVTYAQDARCSREVWTWVSSQLAALGMFGGKPSVQAAV